MIYAQAWKGGDDIRPSEEGNGDDIRPCENLLCMVHFFNGPARSVRVVLAMGPCENLLCIVHFLTDTQARKWGDVIRPSEESKRDDIRPSEEGTGDDVRPSEGNGGDAVPSSHIIECHLTKSAFWRGVLINSNRS